MRPELNEQNRRHVAWWVESLCFGTRKKAQHTLMARDGSVCCLGDACEVYREHGGHLPRIERKDCFAYITNGNIEGESTRLPLEVSDWLGISQSPLVPREIVLQALEGSPAYTKYATSTTTTAPWRKRSHLALTYLNDRGEGDMWGPPGLSRYQIGRIISLWLLGEDVALPTSKEQDLR